MTPLCLCLFYSHGLTISPRRRSFSRSWWRPMLSQTWQKGSDHHSVAASSPEQGTEDAGKSGERRGVRLQLEKRGDVTLVSTTRKCAFWPRNFLRTGFCPEHPERPAFPLFHIRPRVLFETSVIKDPRGGETQELDRSCQTYLCRGEGSPLQHECIHRVDSTGS